MTDRATAFDETDLGMIRRGDMLGPRLGQRVYAALTSTSPAYYLNPLDGTVCTAADKVSGPAVFERHTEALWAGPQGGAEPAGWRREVAEAVARRISIYRDMAPEEDETWGSWYFAAFDMLCDELLSTDRIIDVPPASPAHVPEGLDLATIVAELRQLERPDNWASRIVDGSPETIWAGDPDISPATLADDILARMGEGSSVRRAQPSVLDNLLRAASALIDRIETDEVKMPITNGLINRASDLHRAMQAIVAQPKELPHD